MSKLRRRRSRTIPALLSAGPTSALPAVLVATLVATTVLGCGSGAPKDSSDGAAGPRSSPTAALDPQESASVFLPNGFSGPVPVIVLVPGGGWTSADPAGLMPLAKALVADGAAVVTVTYRTSSQGAYFPVPAEDVACDLSYAVSAVRGAGTTAGQVVLVGHSAGAQLAALVALRPDDLTGDCSYPPVAPDRFVGLAGPYDITALGGVAAPLFGPDRTDSREWAEGNPLEYATLRPELDVLLVHGQDDGLVPLSLSKQFAVALTRGGHTVETVYPKGVDHASVYEAEVAGPIVAEWLGLPSSTG